MLENEFPALNKGVIYLDNACSALKMKSSIEAFKEVCEWGGCGGKRATHLISQKIEEYYYLARKTVSQLINSYPEEIIFTSGTTDGFNKLALSLTLKQNSQIIISALEHNSVFLPFYEKAKREKLNFSIIPLLDFKPDLNIFEKMVSKKTSVVCITMASNIFGGKVDVEKVIEITRRKNPATIIILDAAQYVPTHKIDVKKLNCDALCFSGHKISAPYGTGVLYIRKDLIKKLHPIFRGGGTIKNITQKSDCFKIKYLEDYQGMEAGIQNYAGAYAMAVAMKKISELGYENIRNHISSLVNYACKKISTNKYIRILGKELEEGSIVSFTNINKKFSLKDFEIFASVSKPPLAFRTGRMCADLACIYSQTKSAVRISFFIYNSKKDIDRFVDTLEEYTKRI